MLDIQQEYDSDILFDSPTEWDEDPFIEQKAAIGGDIVLEEELAQQEQKKQERRALRTVEGAAALKGGMPPILKTGSIPVLFKGRQEKASL